MTGLFINTLTERDAARAEAARMRAERDAVIRATVIPAKAGVAWLCRLDSHWYETEPEAWDASRKAAGLDPKGDQP